MHEVYHWKCIAETCVCRRDQFECPHGNFKQVATTISPDEIDRLRAEFASRQIDIDTFREGNQKLRAELAEANAKTGKCGMEGHNEPCYYCGEPCNSLVGNPSRWPVALCHADEPGVVKWHHTGCVMERLAELAEWKERHPYGEVDLDMAIEAETKDLKLRIDTLESAQIDYEVQCAAKDARIKEEFDKYCRNLTELAQLHKESCDAKDARIAELEAYHTNCTDYINGLLGNMADDDKERVAILARAERAEARVAILEKDVMGYLEAIARAERAEASHEQQVIVAANYAERAERAEAERDAAMNVVRWVETWVGQPVGAYSVYALDGLFGMTRDKIAALNPSPTVGGMEE